MAYVHHDEANARCARLRSSTNVWSTRTPLGLHTRAHTHTHARWIGAILGLGLAYAGSQREEIAELLAPLVADPDLPMVGVQLFWVITYDS